MSTRKWRSGNTIELLENGEAFFPAVFDDIARARKTIIIETFIWFDDPIGRQLRDALIAAVARGVTVDITVDGYGSAPLGPDFVRQVTDAGVRLHVYDPRGSMFGVQTNLFRRLHRKLAVIDQTIGYIGGINYSLEQVRDYGPESKQDYHVRVTGPVVEDMHAFCYQALGRLGEVERRPWSSRLRWLRRQLPDALRQPVRDASAILVWRDNHQYPTGVETFYRHAIREAKREIIIANAYFFPGYGFLRDLRQAAARGVRVVLILQGNPDKDYVRTAASTLHHDLLSSGIEVHEYMERPLHAKVAVIDDDWSTVGSSNLDPFSLSLNLEANLIIRDPAFNRLLRERLMALMETACRQLQHDLVRKQRGWRKPLRGAVFHFLRRFPSWARLIPGQVKHIQMAGRDRLTPPPGGSVG